MTDRDKKATTPLPRGYKRSWRNLLINKRYQLRFTLFMAGLAGVLIAALGYWVMFYADRTTTIAINRVISQPCEDVPEIDTEPPKAAAPAPAPPTTDGAGSADGSGDEAGSGAVNPDETGKHHRHVVMGDSSFQTCDDPDPAKRPDDCPALPPPPVAKAPADFVDKVASKWSCEMRHAGVVAGLHRGRTEILLVLVGSGLLLVLGLAVYGIKMTHRVAGPLYKVTLYMAKMREGRLDKVYNLRKGDQLVEFYEHFKSGHKGVVGMEQADITRLKALLEAVDQDQAKLDSPELRERVAELRDVVARKEKSLE